MRFDKTTIRKFCTVQNMFAAVYVILIFTLLLIPSIGVKARKDLHVDNRVAAPFPEISCKNYVHFASQFEKYLADRFQMRKEYIRVWNFCLFHFFQESPCSEIVIGKDGFIFLASHVANKENKNTLFKTLLTHDKEVISSTAGVLRSYQPTFQKARAQLLFVAVATKHSLNHDKIPEKILQDFPGDPEGIPICTKITEELKKADPIYAEKYFLDLYPEAFAANQKIQLIPPKNFHWIPGPYTHLAAHRIARKFNVTQEDFVLRRENYDLRNIDSDLKFFFRINLDNQSWVLSEKNNPVKRVRFTDKIALKDCPSAIAEQIYYAENPAAKGGSILAIGDSFTPVICQDLARYFSRVTAMDLAAMQRYSPQVANHVFKEIIKTYQPEYVVTVSHCGYLFADVIADAINDPSLSFQK